MVRQDFDVTVPPMLPHPGPQLTEVKMQLAMSHFLKTILETLQCSCPKYAPLSNSAQPGPPLKILWMLSLYKLTDKILDFINNNNLFIVY